ncbi:hypothetical protein KR032_006944, partial [Drosophila birchii]
SINGRVVGGVDAAKSQFPHQISLRNGGSHSCGGSIISRNFILTAAHCVTNQDSDGNYVAVAAERLSIRAGSNDRLSGGVLVQVAEVIFHEGYGSHLRNDVALLRLETPLIYSTNIQAIDLPTADTPADVDVIISGWGRLWHLGDLPRYLQYNTLKSLSLERCDELIGWGIPGELCLIHEADNGACNGDSGGPAIYNGQVVGIAGFVWSACGTSNPDGYTRVHYFNDWIRAHSDVHGGILSQVAEVIFHENYGNFENDIALLRLETPLIYSASIQPIPLPTFDTPVDADIVISGWGRLWHLGDLPRYLQYNTLKSISTERCEELIDFGFAGELCLIHEVDNGACNGDSGGPAIYNGEVVGIAGFVVGGCGSGYPDGYARVFYFKDWIRKYVAD